MTAPHLHVIKINYEENSLQFGSSGSGSGLLISTWQRFSCSWLTLVMETVETPSPADLL